MADLDPSDYTVGELRDELDEIDDPDTLEELREAETDGENRTGATEAIDERLDAVADDQQDEEEGGGTSTDGTGTGIVEIRNQVRNDAGDLIGRALDGIVEIEKNEGDWRVVIEIIERNSVPDTQDILGRYALQLDGTGEITGYRRLDRYRRGDTRQEEVGASEPPY